jgi:hypothetical protein
MQKVKRFKLIGRQRRSLAGVSGNEFNSHKFSALLFDEAIGMLYVARTWEHKGHPKEAVLVVPANDCAEIELVTSVKKFMEQNQIDFVDKFVSEPTPEPKIAPSVVVTKACAACEQDFEVYHPAQKYCDECKSSK